MKQIVALFAGVGIGIGLALLVGWVWLPVDPYDTTPDVLRSDYKDEYVRLVSLAYQVEGDRETACAAWRLWTRRLPPAPWWSKPNAGSRKEKSSGW
jgi:hypothetical protein